MGGPEQLPRGEEGKGPDLAKRNQSTGKNLRSDVGILLLLLRERSTSSLRSEPGNSTGLSRVVVPVSHRDVTTAVIRLQFCQRGGRFKVSWLAASTTPFTRGLISSPRESTTVDQTDGKRNDPPTNNNLLSTEQQTISPSSTYRPRIGENRKKFTGPSLFLSFFLCFPELSHCHPTSASAAEYHSIRSENATRTTTRHDSTRLDSTRFDPTLGTTPWDRK